MQLTLTLSRSLATWDSNTWVLSLHSGFSPRVTAAYMGVIGTMDDPEQYFTLVYTLSSGFFLAAIPVALFTWPVSSPGSGASSHGV